MKVFTKHAPDLLIIVAFGSICTIYRDPGKNSLAQRAQFGVIIGQSDETKWFRVFIQNENKVTVTQQVRNIATLSVKLYGQIQRALELGDQGVVTVAPGTSSIGAGPMVVTNIRAKDEVPA